MATSQPIALPSTHPSSSSNSSQDYTMGSYSGSTSGDFNPASYTRHFLGSPISWRAGSFGGRVPYGSPTAQLLSTIDTNEFRHSKLSSSMDSERGSLFNAWSVFDMEGEHCRNYNCCGLQLNDLHALLEHFEEVHILVADPGPPQIQVPFNPQRISPQITHQQPMQPHQNQLVQQQQQQQQHQQQQQPFDTDDMELELDLDNSTHPTPAATISSRSSPSSGGPSPPHTPPLSAPLSTYPSPRTDSSSTLSYLQPQSQYAQQQQYGGYQSTNVYSSAQTSPYASQPPSPGSTAGSNSNHNGVQQQQHPTVHTQLIHSHLSQAGHYQTTGPNVLTHPEEAFNPYARFAADYSSSMPGTQFNASGGEEILVPNGATIVGENGSGPSEYGVVNGQYPSQIGGVGAQGQQCIPPALLFASTSDREGGQRAEGRRVPSPTGNSSKLKLKVRGGGSEPNTRIASSVSTPAPPTPIQPINPTTSPRTSSPHTPSTQMPTSSLLLSKPFRCPKPNCNKSYKQANGLKYHMTHGSCNFAPPKDLEHVKDLLERKRREREANSQNNGSSGAGNGNVLNSSGAALSRSASVGSIGSGSPSTVVPGGTGSEPYLTHSAYGDLGSITETELREVEREAEKRVKPFACGVGDCQRRYKNMNGLRYHYQHSGDHGVMGLALLAGGLHECLSGGNGNGPVNSNGGGGLLDKSKSKGADEREGRRRALHRSAGGVGSVRGGSASVPVSRAGSVVGASRVGTPAGYASGAVTPFSTASGATTPFSPTPFSTSGATTPFSPTSSASFLPGTATGYLGNNTSPPLTPLTAAVQGLGLGGLANQTRSQSHSPPGPVYQQQQQLAYQAQFAEAQRMQFLQAQQVAQAQQQQQQQQQQSFVQQQEATFAQLRHQQEFADAQAQAQQDFVDAQAQRVFVEAQMVQAQHVQQQREYHQQQQQFGNDLSMT